MKKNHMFVICAYKESPYLEECIKSLKAQTIKTDIIMITSTPSEYLDKMAEKYELELFINKGESGITQDWNFGISCCNADIVTIAHQDDVYYDNYVEELFKTSKSVDKPIIFFSDYNEIRDGKHTNKGKNLKIKRILLKPLSVKLFRNSKWVRRRCLSLGNPICCPSVSFFRENTPEILFNNRFKSNEDWEAWEVLSRMDGAFLYSKKILMGHRIHEESATSKIINDNHRTVEDYEMFLKFWPKKIAAFLNRFYINSEKSNSI